MEFQATQPMDAPETPSWAADPPPGRQYQGAFSFIRRHWNGDYSLGRSYWVNTFLVSLVAPALAYLCLPFLSENFAARYASMAFLAIFAGGIVLWIWAIKGTLSSAGKHSARGGHRGWAMAAKAVIALGVLRTVGDLVVSLPTLKEHAVVAAGEQFGEKTLYELRADGRSLLLRGGINDGTAEGLSRALNKAPAVTTVVLSSSGGWLREGRMLADAIHARGLDTYVEDYCASACTIAFLAGKERAAAPAARIGFHASKKVGLVESAPSDETTQSQLRELYRQARLSPAFVDKALGTPHAKMWHPSVDEMLAAGVLTRRSLGGETAALATSVKSREDLSTAFHKVELYAQLAAKAPDEYERIIDAAWDKLRAGATDAQVTAAARDQLMTVLPRFLPMASDATLLGYHDLQAAQVEALRAVDARACSETVFPTGNHQLVVATLPREMTLKEQDFLGRVMKEADPARVPKADRDELVRVVGLAFKDMTNTQRTLFSDESFRKTAGPKAACDAISAFYAGMSALPSEQRARALRVLYAAN